MRIALLAALVLVACNAPRGTSTSTQAISCAPAATIEARDLVETSFGETLTRTRFEPRGNHHPIARFVWRSLDLGEVAAAVLVSGGVAIVRAEGSLELFDARGCPRTIATDVLPDLVASPDGRTIAFVRSVGDGSGISLYRDGATRRLVSAYADADRPIFVDDRTLLFVGAAKPGVSTFHQISLDDEVPHALPIEGVPATRDGYSIANGLVRFHDGEIFRSGAVR